MGEARAHSGVPFLGVASSGEYQMGVSSVLQLVRTQMDNGSKTLFEEEMTKNRIKKRTYKNSKGI